MFSAGSDSFYLTEAVFKGEIELVGIVQHHITLFCFAAGQISTFSIDVNIDVF